MARDRVRCSACGKPLAVESDAGSRPGLCWASPAAVIATGGRDPRFRLQCDGPRLGRVFELERLLERLREAAVEAASAAYDLPSDAEAAADLYAALDKIVAMIDDYAPPD
jgi:hypothetical protein